eukprot:CAMPEP_0204013114 /NCGR_PEP_ID=MMETSP0360-20130528/24481_1 /ASSEMBLY_ACC=CAM_ASM_000342 /TAXON_ID=268821 /ORGANISM="Scrippsiella Hangoei, Strain SHTV-5" /LENGTH=38 /DNA_ID= /DNA_START= /DNA_END= /DNA_ORIENTATION=
MAMLFPFRASKQSTTDIAVISVKKKLSTVNSNTSPKSL